MYRNLATRTVVDIERRVSSCCATTKGSCRSCGNVCRHRGRALLEAGPLWSRRLCVPTIKWTYELTGELAHAPHMGLDFDKDCHSLKRVKLPGPSRA